MCVCVCAWVIWKVGVYVCVRVWTLAVCVCVCVVAVVDMIRTPAIIVHLVSVGVAGCPPQNVGEQARAETTAGH